MEERQPRLPTEEELYGVAVHEAGHARMVQAVEIVLRKQITNPDADFPKLETVCVSKRADGYVYWSGYRRNEDILSVAVAGVAAEALVLHDAMFFTEDRSFRMATADYLRYNKNAPRRDDEVRKDFEKFESKFKDDWRKEWDNYGYSVVKLFLKSNSKECIIRLADELMKGLKALPDGEEEFCISGEKAIEIMGEWK